MKFKSFLLVLTLFGSPSYGNQIDCVSMKKNQELVFELRHSNGFANCILLGDLPNVSDIHFITDSNFDYRIELKELHQNNSMTHISDYNSNANNLSAFKINTLNRNVGFTIHPSSKLYTNKNVSVSYIEHDSVFLVSVKMVDISNSSPPPSPPPGGDCFYENGVRMCNDIK